MHLHIALRNIAFSGALVLITLFSVVLGQDALFNSIVRSGPPPDGDPFDRIQTSLYWTIFALYPTIALLIGVIAGLFRATRPWLFALLGLLPMWAAVLMNLFHEPLLTIVLTAVLVVIMALGCFLGAAGRRRVGQEKFRST